MDISTLTSILQSYCRQSFESFVATHGRSELIGFALYTSEGFPGLGASAATRQGQKANSLCSIGEFLFECDEWDLRAPLPDAANQMISQWYFKGESVESENEAWFDEYCDAISTSSIAALSSLVDAGLFGTKYERDELFLMLGVSDSLISYTKGTAWSQELNTRTMHNRYKTFAATVASNGSA